jgi:hypothetical protein
MSNLRQQTYSACREPLGHLSPYQRRAQLGESDLHRAAQSIAPEFAMAIGFVGDAKEPQPHTRRRVRLGSVLGPLACPRNIMLEGFEHQFKAAGGVPGGMLYARP